MRLSIYLLVFVFGQASFAAEYIIDPLSGKITGQEQETRVPEEWEQAGKLKFVTKYERFKMTVVGIWPNPVESFVIYKDESTRKVWATRVKNINKMYPDEGTYQHAINSCEKLMASSCDTALTGNLRWRLPTKAELQIGLQNGLIELAPGSWGAWTSHASTDPRFPDLAWAYDPSNRGSSLDRGDDFHMVYKTLPQFSVTCVADDID